MKQVDLIADEREAAGGNQSRKLKRSNMIPAVLYEHTGSNTLLKLDEKQVKHLIEKYGENMMVKLKLNEREIPAIIKEVQRGDLDRKIIHLDFQSVMLHEIIHAEVPIVVMNAERAEKNGWIINRQMTQLEVEGEVEKIPQNIIIDASKLKAGDVLKVSDLELSEELSVWTDYNNIVLSVRSYKEQPIDTAAEHVEPETV